VSHRDFRSARRRLSPSAFLAGPRGPDPPAPDLVDPGTWSSIICFPDDVSIRTADRCGTALRTAWSMRSAWIDVAGSLQDGTPDPGGSPITYAALDATDELHASVYTALVGFYRVAFSTLRAIVEHMTVGLHLELAQDESALRAWRDGTSELRFGDAANVLHRNVAIARLENHLDKVSGGTLFRQKTTTAEPGCARRLFCDLSKFTHGDPPLTHAEMWDGTGPVFDGRAFDVWLGAYYETYALCLLEAKLARPSLSIQQGEAPCTLQELYSQAVAVVAKQSDDEFVSVLNAVPDCLW